MATSGTLRFESGETNKSFTIPLLDDSETEGAETILLALSNATGGASLGAKSSAVLSLIDDETPPANFATTAISAS